MKYDIMVTNVKRNRFDKESCFGVTLSQCFCILFHLSIYLWMIQCIQCTPDASQEGALKSFKNYKDITMFHYIIPKETTRATWQFAAFMDHKKCLPRKVHIYLQWGSFPVISDKKSFPTDFNVSQEYQYSITTETAFETKSMVILPVNSPQPGDWFIGAHLSYWDEKVHQQGLSHKCQYSLGSIATWSRANNVQSIPVGYAKTMRTTGTESYYKIYIGVNIWSFHVHIWDCTFTLKKFRNSKTNCIRSMTLQGRTLPVLNHTHPGPAVVNITMNESYTFTELAPYEDSYYYLLVVSDSIIDFTVKVSTSECSVKNAEKPYVRRVFESSSLIDDNSVQTRKDLINSKKMYNNNYINDNKKLITYNEFSLDDELKIENEKCMPRFQLARIQHTQTFSLDYILKGEDWVIVSDISPTILQFNILPLIDIGGTLDISIYLEVDKQFSQQFIIVDTCIQNGNIPTRINGRILCENYGFSLRITSDKRDEKLLIPYPRADTWYVSLQVKCYIKSTPVQCDLKKIPVSLKIRLNRCVYSGNYSCGAHGICQDVQHGLLYYSSCECFGGYKGWACNDDSNVSFQTSTLLMTLMLTISNIFFLPSIYVAIKRGFYAEGLIYFSTMLFSTLYHACDQEFMTYCIAKYEVLQYTDFFSSTLAFWVTLVAMAELPAQYVPLAHMCGVIITAYGVQLDKAGLYNILILLTLGILILMFSYTRFCIKTKSWKNSKRFLNLLIGLIFVSLGIIIYCIVETEANYYYMHSAWHVMIAVSLVFLLPPSKGDIFFGNSLSSQNSSGRTFISQNTVTKVKSISLANLTSPTATVKVVNSQGNLVTQPALI